MKNLIGNALTILILLMSVFFFASAVMVGAAQRNWKAEVAALTSKLEAAENQVNEAKSSNKEQLMTIEREKVARAQQLANLYSQARQIREQLDERNKLLTAEIEANQSNQTRLREAEARLAQLDTDLSTEKSRSTQLKNTLSEQFLKVQTLTQQSFEQATVIETLETSVADLSSVLAKKEKVMDALGIDDEFRVRDVVPKLTATIVAIGNDDNFAIKLGSDDGVRVDHEFDIYRSSRYIGRATVTKVRQDVAVLTPIRGFMQSPIKEGDYVTSEL